MVLASIADVATLSTLAICGIAMTPLPVPLVFAECGASLLFGLILGAVKIPVFARLRIS